MGAKDKTQTETDMRQNRHNRHNSVAPTLDTKRQEGQTETDKDGGTDCMTAL